MQSCLVKSWCTHNERQIGGMHDATTTTLVRKSKNIFSDETMLIEIMETHREHTQCDKDTHKIGMDYR